MTRRRSRAGALVTATLLASSGLVLTASPAHAATHIVGTFGELTTAITTANASAGADVITFSADITATATLPAITDTTAIDGGGFTYDGNGRADSGFVITSSVTVSELSVGGVDSDGMTITGTNLEVTIENSQFSGNGSDGIQIDVGGASTVILTGVTADGNEGNGVLVDGEGSSTITLSAVSANDNGPIEDDFGYDGIDVSSTGDSTLTVSDSDASGNSDDGFDVEVYDGAMGTVIRSVATENVDAGFSVDADGTDATVIIIESNATDNGDDGFILRPLNGGNITAEVYSDGNGDDGIQVSASAGPGIATIVNSTLIDNGYGLFVPGEGSGAGDVVLASSTITGSTYVGILASLPEGDALRVENSTISGNGNGLNINGVDGTFALVHSTVTNNGAGTSPTAAKGLEPANGEAYTAAYFSGSFTMSTISHSIISGNLSEYDVAATTDVDLAFDYSLIGTIDEVAPVAIGAAADANGNVFGITNPRLGPLAMNGGPTATHLPEADSPVLNIGDPSISGAPAYDQRGEGYPRVVGIIDLGAVERHAELANTGTSPIVPAAGALAALMVLLGGMLALRRRA